MKCKKCGFSGIETNGDWIVCPSCGAKYFNTNINSEEETSATKAINKIESAEDNKKKGKKKKKPGKLKEAADFLFPIVLAVVIAFLLKSFVIANAVVPTGSMIATIKEGDRLIASRIAYNNSSPERYDIILLNYPDDEKQIFVKRIIGLPGDYLDIVNGVVYLTDENGEKVEVETDFINPKETPVGSIGPFYVPKKGDVITTDGQYYYHGENIVGVGNEFPDLYCIKNSSGELVIREDCYFCMGDNRNHSHDSRFWINKFVAKDKIIGEAKFRYYPFSEAGKLE